MARAMGDVLVWYWRRLWGLERARRVIHRCGVRYCVGVRVASRSRDPFALCRGLAPAQGCGAETARGRHSGCGGCVLTGAAFLTSRRDGFEVGDRGGGWGGGTHLILCRPRSSTASVVTCTVRVRRPVGVLVAVTRGSQWVGVLTCCCLDLSCYSLVLPISFFPISLPSTIGVCDTTRSCWVCSDVVLDVG